MSAETVESGASAAPRKGVSILFGLTLLGLLLFLWLLLGFATNSFWTPNNISNLLRQGAMTAILAVGQTFVIITAGIDLSVGAVVGFTSVIVAWLLAAGVPLWIAIILTLAFGVLIGAFHAFGIVRMGLPPFIITLATLTSLRGIGLLITNGSTISITNEAFTNFSRADFLGVPSLFWMVIVVAIPAYVFLHLSRFGRYLFAVGSNSEAARLSGVNVHRTIYLAYILSSTCAAFVGLLLASRIGIGNATQAEGWELQAIASSVIGGTSLFGAVGSVHGPLLGAFILATINNGANLLNVNSFWQRIITGALIIVIVYFDQLRRRSAARRRRTRENCHESRALPTTRSAGGRRSHANRNRAGRLGPPCRQPCRHLRHGLPYLRRQTSVPRISAGHGPRDLGDGDFWRARDDDSARHAGRGQPLSLLWRLYCLPKGQTELLHGHQGSRRPYRRCVLRGDRRAGG